MTVNLPSPIPETILPIAGIRWGCAYAGIRKKPKDDVAVMLIDDGASVAGVFTQNECCAAPVLVCKRHLPHSQVRALVINAGCANAATGTEGLADAQEACAHLAQKLGVLPTAILPFSTGVILERLPMAKLKSGIDDAYDQAKQLMAYSPDQPQSLSVHQTAWLSAASAIMTTDTVAKIASTLIDDIAITGIAKGAGMIHPNMATMLGYIATSASIAPTLLAQMTREIADQSFNTITIDGDTSTNDSLILIATHKVGKTIHDREDPRYRAIFQGLLTVARTLSQAIVRDGEGATKFVTIQVLGAKTSENAKAIAEKIALSPLVKTAFFASDPNLGRILAAIGNAGAGLDMAQVALKIGDILVAENGARALGYGTSEEAQALQIMRGSEFVLTVEARQGEACYTKYTCDYSYDYIKINAEYRT